VLVSQSAPLLVVVARSEDVSLQANETVAALTKQFGGRGGGRPELAQAGGLNSGPEEALEAARRLIISWRTGRA
jgi:alanyl-tRNA synthetase